MTRHMKSTSFSCARRRIALVNEVGDEGVNLPLELPFERPVRIETILEDLKEPEPRRQASRIGRHQALELARRAVLVATVEPLISGEDTARIRWVMDGSSASLVPGQGYAETGARSCYDAGW